MNGWFVTMSTQPAQVTLMKHDDLTLYNWLHFQINTESCFALSLFTSHSFTVFRTSKFPLPGSSSHLKLT